jgi:hypothetical protein
MHLKLLYVFLGLAMPAHATVSIEYLIHRTGHFLLKDGVTFDNMQPMHTSSIVPEHTIELDVEDKGDFGILNFKIFETANMRLLSEPTLHAQWGKPAFIKLGKKTNNVEHIEFKLEVIANKPVTEN